MNIDIISKEMIIFAHTGKYMPLQFVNVVANSLSIDDIDEVKINLRSMVQSGELQLDDDLMVVLG
jgi:hypothetical protein